MTTVGELITTAHRIIGALGKGRALNASEEADGLERFKQMMASWSLDEHNLMFYTKISKDLSIDSSGIEIGDGAAWDEERPEWIESGYTNATGIETPLKVIGKGEYDSIGDKGIVGAPIYLFYDRTFPNGTLFLYPCSNGTITVTLRAAMQLSGAYALDSADDLVLPSSYEEAITYGLAFRLAPEFDRQLDAMTISIGTEAINRIKIKNAADQAEPVALEILRLRRRFNINEG